MHIFGTKIQIITKPFQIISLLILRNRLTLAQYRNMNPYSIPLIIVPLGITVAASLTRKKLWKWSLLLFAVAVFWGILQPSVDWAFSHPFNPNDGAPKTFAFLFGWVYGLVLVIIPTYWISRGIQCIFRKKNRKNR